MKVSNGYTMLNEENILINITPRESRIAWLENGVLQEAWIERYANKGLVGNVYKGKVVRIMPGMQAAFVDIGLEKAAFLHEKDLAGQPHTIVAKNGDGSNGQENNPSVIASVLHEGQTILVQVMKDPLGTKGARVTMQVTLPTRHVVYMPNDDHTGISSRIEDETERQALREQMARIKDKHNIEGGFIVRTASNDVSEAIFEADIVFINQLWKETLKKSKTIKKGVLRKDLPHFLKILRDLKEPQVERIRVDSTEAFMQMLNFAKTYVPALAKKIQRYDGEAPIFELHSVEDEIQKALEPKVFLKSGGYLIIEQTEALTTIDVNTGGYVGHLHLEATIYQTNLEAAHAIARQIRLRNLGGIIIVDFIDMSTEKNQQKLLETLTKALAKDQTKSSVVGITKLGLVEITRKRTRESLGQLLTEDCHHCKGKGKVKTVETMINSIFRDVTRYARQFEAQAITVIASWRVVEHVQEFETDAVAELESFIGADVNFQIGPYYTIEMFDVVAK